MSTAAEDAELVERFRRQAIACSPRAPLYGALSDVIAADVDLALLLRHAPAEQRLPVLLLASSHKVLLDSPEHPLAAWYPNLTETPRDPAEPALAATFSQFLAERRAEVVHLLRTRRTQTNEVGRCAMFLLAFGQLAPTVGPIAHLDVGASGGLNLLLDRFEYRFEPGGTVGGPSPVVLEVGTRGDPPIPTSIPPVAARCGIDVAPVDVTDDDEARWLEACVWPDQADRFRRLRAAIGLARAEPPELLAGDATASLDPAIERMAHRGHPVVTNSWVLNYLTDEARTAYVTELDRIGADTELSWVFAESPAFAPGLPAPTELDHDDLTVLTLVTWRSGVRTVRHLATCHPHGFWIHWR